MEARKLCENGRRVEEMRKKRKGRAGQEDYSIREKEEDDYTK